MKKYKRKHEPDLIVLRGNGPWCYHSLLQVEGIDGKSHGTVSIWVHSQLQLTRQEALDRTMKAWSEWIDQRNRWTIVGAAIVTKFNLLWGPTLSSAPVRLRRTV